MPELPEVEAARRAIEEHCLGKKIIKSVIANDSKVIDGVSPSEFEASILNKTIVAAHRKGKNMWLQLDSPPFPSFQFGMAGAIYIKGVAVTKYKRSAVNDSDEWPSKYSMFFVTLNDGLEFSFTDKRRFARVRLLDDPASVLPISELGPDALLEPMTVDELHNSLSKKKNCIKALLLDQSFISGIGNWIADEVLYQARIHPSDISCNLSKEKCATLHKCIKEVIEIGADSNQFPSDWIFHFRDKKPGKAFINGQKIEFINAGGRTTAYVPELQKLSGGQASKAAAKTSEQTSKRNEDADEDADAGEPESGRRNARNPSRRNKSAPGSDIGQKTVVDKGKKTTAKKKSNENSGDTDNDVDTNKKQSGAPGKRVPAKRKYQEKLYGNDKEARVEKKKSGGQGQTATAKSLSKKMNCDTEAAGSYDNDDTEDETTPTKVAKGKRHMN